MQNKGPFRILWSVTYNGWRRLYNGWRRSYNGWRRSHNGWRRSYNGWKLGRTSSDIPPQVINPENMNSGTSNAKRVQWGDQNTRYATRIRDTIRSDIWCNTIPLQQSHHSSSRRRRTVQKHEFLEETGALSIRRWTSSWSADDREPYYGDALNTSNDWTFSRSPPFRSKT